ncbi:MAG TPA: FtsL-like putative cell division protein [Flavobacteriales bacterium]|nr:FtsL-like putative cell division protein [Flavobacteriales bacterium]
MNKLREKQEEEVTPAEPTAKAKRAAGQKSGEPGAVARVPKMMIGVLNGSFLTKEKVLGNMPFILFCAGLMITYIAYGYHTERIVRDLDRVDQELKELRSEHITVRSQLEKMEQQSQVAVGIGELGLKESRVPPVKLDVDEDELNATRNP